MTNRKLRVLVLVLLAVVSAASMTHLATDSVTTTFISEKETVDGNVTMPERPDASAYDSNPVDEGDPVNLTGVNSTDDVKIVSYEWDFDNNGTIDATGINQTHTFRDSGDYKVTLFVTDTAGLTARSTTTVTVKNVPPTAVVGDDQSVDVGQSVTFDAGESSDPGADELRYEWDFGDGNSATGEATSHTYDEEDTYNATVTVRDGDGGSDTATVSVTVENVAPNADAGVDKEVGAGQAVTLDASGSTRGDSSDILSYAWDVDNDGTYEREGVKPEHTYSEEGTYTAKVRVSDGDGGSDTDTVTVNVTNVDPDAEAGENQNITVGETASFDGSESSKGDPTDKLNYSWDFDDGSTGTGVEPDHTYSSSGTYVVKLTLTDGDGGRDVDKTEVTVEPDKTQPEADAGGNQTVSTNETVSFDGSASSDNVGIDSYEWDFGDGTTATGPNPTHAFENSGTYSVVLTVTDEAGNSDSDTVWITVE